MRPAFFLITLLCLLPTVGQTAVAASPDGCGPRASDPGSALLFDGADDRAIIPVAPAAFYHASTWTIEFWMYRQSGDNVVHVVGQRSGCDQNFPFQIAGDPSGGYGVGWTGPTGSCGMTLAQIPNETWAHIAVTCDGNFVRGYVNGEFTSMMYACPNEPVDQPLVVGGSGGCSSRFPGYLDELRLWRIAKDAARIAYEYDSTVNPDTCQGLVGYWKFDDPDCSQVVMDSSLGCVHGHLGYYIGADNEDPSRVDSEAPLTGAQVAVAPPSTGPMSAGVSVDRVTPNPARAGASLQFSLAREDHAEVDVVDVAGATVRRIHSGRLTAGPHHLTWDGRNDQGAAVASGVYFLRVRSGAGEGSRALVLTR